MKNFIAISMLLLLSLRVIAGDPGGISLLVKALPSANDYKYVLDGFFREGANKQVISSQADSLIKISRIWADFFPANTSNQPI
ncbi:hypothetical protein EXY08_27025 [Klebsiella pneumoniae]|nr:hypothetical protein [Klebsiella pneumoniae]